MIFRSRKPELNNPELPDSLAERYGISEESYREKVEQAAAGLVEVIRTSGQVYDSKKTNVLIPTRDILKEIGLYPVELGTFVDVLDMADPGLDQLSNPQQAT